MVNTLGRECGRARTARIQGHPASAKRGDLVRGEAGDERNRELPAIDEVRDRHANQRVVAAIGDRAGEINRAVFSHPADALHGERDARHTHFRVHTLVGAAVAGGVVLVNRSGVAGRGAHRAIGENILKADDITDDAGIVIRLSVAQVCAHQRDRVRDPVRRDNERYNIAGVADNWPDAGSVEDEDAVTDRVADMNVRRGGKQSDANAATSASRRNSLGAGRERAE